MSSRTKTSSANGKPVCVDEVERELKAVLTDELRNEFVAELNASVIPVIRDVMCFIIPEVEAAIRGNLAPPPQPNRQSTQRDHDENLLRRSLVFVRVSEKPATVLRRDRGQLDCETVVSILDEIGADAVPEQAFRIGIYDSSEWRPVKAIFRNSIDSGQVMHFGKLLKPSSSYSKVFTRRSRSPTEPAERTKARAAPEARRSAIDTPNTSTSVDRVAFNVTS